MEEDFVAEVDFADMTEGVAVVRRNNRFDRAEEDFGFREASDVERFADVGEDDEGDEDGVAFTDTSEGVARFEGFTEEGVTFTDGSGVRVERFTEPSEADERSEVIDLTGATEAEARCGNFGDGSRCEGTLRDGALGDDVLEDAACEEVETPFEVSRDLVDVTTEETSVAAVDELESERREVIREPSRTKSGKICRTC
jgi:hypothetical protein